MAWDFNFKTQLRDCPKCKTNLYVKLIQFIGNFCKQKCTKCNTFLH